MLAIPPRELAYHWSETLVERSLTMSRFRRKQRGNPDWGKPIPIPVLMTEFEQQVERLGLTNTEYADSAELRHWCDRNRNRVYIPEWLLKEWRLQVEEVFAGS